MVGNRLIAVVVVVVDYLSGHMKYAGGCHPFVQVTLCANCRHVVGQEIELTAA